MKCLVTGATGFIGRPLCLQLSGAGHSVVALSLSGAPLPGGTTTHAIDLAGHSVPRALLEGVDIIVHLAGLAHQDAPESAYRKLNLEGTQRLAEAALAAGVGSFIFVSSVKAMGAARSAEPRREADRQLPEDPYGLSKWQAEEALREVCSGLMSLTIIRPVLVYGADAKGNLQRLARAARLGLPRPPAVGQRSMIALDDLVDLLSTLVHKPPTGVNTWIACGAQHYGARDIFDALRRAYGMSPGKAWLPLFAWRIAARGLDFTGGQPAGSTFDKLFGTELYDSRALRRATGWVPRRTLAEVVKATPGLAV